jgi:hypothetical protein
MIRLLAVTMLFFVAPAYAGGSFAVEIEFAPIKQQIPVLWQSITSAFDIASSGGASTIGNNVNERLGHRRVGPYCLEGKPKSQNGPNSLLFCFNTEYFWLDEKGRKNTLEHAFDVKENFVSLEITPLK